MATVISSPSRAPSDTILENLGIEEYDIVPVKDDPTYHPGRCAELVIDGDPIGRFGEIHPIVAERYELHARSYAARLDLEKLFAHYNPEPGVHLPCPSSPLLSVTSLWSAMMICRC